MNARTRTALSSSLVLASVAAMALERAFDLELAAGEQREVRLEGGGD